MISLPASAQPDGRARRRFPLTAARVIAEAVGLLLLLASTAGAVVIIGLVLGDLA